MPNKYEDRRKVRSQTFSLRVNADEQRMLKGLACTLQRTRSDVLRLLIRQAFRELGVEEQHSDVGTRKGQA